MASKTEQLRLGLIALGWKPDHSHPARGAWRGGNSVKIDGTLVKRPPVFRYFQGGNGTLRLSVTGKTGDSVAVSEAAIQRIIAAGVK